MENVTLSTLQSIVLYDKDGVKDAIRRGDCVAVLAIDSVNYLVFGQLRLVKYARFLLQEYFPKYQKLTKRHAEALMEKDREKISAAERKIKAYKEAFFAWYLRKNKDLEK